MFGQESFQRTGAVYRLVSVFDDEIFGVIGEFDFQFFVFQSLVDVSEEEFNDSSDVVFRQRLEHNDLIQSVEEFRTEVGAEVGHYHVLGVRADGSVFVYAIQQVLGTDVGGHDEDGVFEINGSALGVGDVSVIEYLEKYVEYVRMGFFNLIE